MSGPAPAVTVGTPSNGETNQANDEILHEMHRQLKSACRVVSSLKAKVEELTAANAKLVQSETIQSDKIILLEKANAVLNSSVDQNKTLSFGQQNQIDGYKKEISRLVEVQASLQKRLASYEPSDDSIADAHKKMKIAQDLMAKTIALHRKELEEWDHKCKGLETMLERCKEEHMATEASLRETICFDNKEIMQLKQQVDSLRCLSKRESSSISVQTTSSNPIAKDRWNPMIWLLCLKLLSQEHIGNVQPHNQPEAMHPIVQKPETKEQSTMTKAQEVTPATPHMFDAWWTKVQDASADEVRIWQVKKELKMTSPQLLSALSDIYVAKIVADEVDDRQNNTRQRLAEVMHVYFLKKEGTAHAAEMACIRLVTGILDHLRPITVKAYDMKAVSAALLTEKDYKTFTAEVSSRMGVSDCIRRRVSLFARFLGMRIDDQPPLPENGLNLFLEILMMAQQGSVPLLPISGEKVMIELSRILKILDLAFSKELSVVRERIKNYVADTIAEFDEVNLDLVLEYATSEWIELYQKRETRLQALFQSACYGCAIDLHQFEKIFRKAETDIQVLPTFRQCLRMYEQICLHERIDGEAFAKVLRERAVGAIDAKACFQELVKTDSEQEALFEKLDPQYATVLHTIGRINLTDFDNQGLGHGLSYKWKILNELMKERRFPELSNIIYHAVVQEYSRGMRILKHESAELEMEKLADKPTNIKTKRKSLENIRDSIVDDSELNISTVAKNRTRGASPVGLRAPSIAQGRPTSAAAHDSSDIRSRPHSQVVTRIRGDPTVKEPASPAIRSLLAAPCQGPPALTGPVKEVLRVPETNISSSNVQTSMSLMRSDSEPAKRICEEGSDNALADDSEGGESARSSRSNIAANPTISPTDPSLAGTPQQTTSNELEGKARRAAVTFKAPTRPSREPDAPLRVEKSGSGRALQRKGSITSPEAPIAAVKPGEVPPILKKSSLKSSPSDDVSLKAMLSCPLFHQVPEAAICAIFKSSNRRVLRHRQPLFRQGDRGESMFLVCSGEVQCSIDGAEVRRFAPGQSFGEVSLLLYQTYSLYHSRGTQGAKDAAAVEKIMTRTADVVCLAASVLLEITAETVTRLQETFPCLAFNVQRIGQSQLQEAEANGSAEAKKSLALLGRLRPFMAGSFGRKGPPTLPAAAGGGGGAQAEAAANTELVRSFVGRASFCAEI